MAIIKALEEHINALREPVCVHSANSSAVRLMCLYAEHYVWCNRGVNGIEGSLSTAAGFSLVTEEKVVVVIGDLSFFYDENALWNTELRGNLRILLLNNGEGNIFRLLSGLNNSPAAKDYISAAHHTSAEGICRQNNVAYLSCREEDDMSAKIKDFLCKDFSRPVLLEIFTSGEADARAYQDYLKAITLLGV